MQACSAVATGLMGQVLPLPLPCVGRLQEKSAGNWQEVEKLMGELEGVQCDSWQCHRQHHATSGKGIPCNMIIK